MRMKFLRILPETWARTSWFVSSFTLNIALGNVSTTVAITSIASSFDKLSPAVPSHVLLSRLALTQSKFSIRCRLPPPCARSEHSYFHRRLLPSSHLSEPGHPAFRCSPSARWRLPCRSATSCRGPLRRSLAPAALHASARRSRVLQNPVPPKTLRLRPRPA